MVPSIAMYTKLFNLVSVICFLSFKFLKQFSLA